MKRYDVIVVGTGGGSIVVEAALQKGLRCALIEKGRFGGTCLNRGCIPTKVLATAADYVREIAEVAKIGVDAGTATMNWEKVSQRVWQKIDFNKKIQAAYESMKNLDVYRGTGYFTAEKTLQVTLHDGTITEEMTADKVFIGVGAHTTIPDIVGLQEAGYISSESLFGDKYPDKPYKSLIVLGGGPIGTEFAHIFAAAGTKVTLIQRNVRLLPKEDEDISAQILTDLRGHGIDIYLNRKAMAVRLESGEKVLTFHDRDTGESLEVRAEEIMLATGITPYTDALKMENTTIEMDERGFIRTNEFLETSVDGVWAFGDVNGGDAFRHKANYEAEIITHNLFGDHEPHNWRWARYDLVPAVTFTYPQVSHVGLTEKQAIAKGYAVETGVNHYSSTAKGYALGFEPGNPHDGFVKIIVDTATNNILGIHAIGPQASVLTQPFVNLMNAGETKLKPVNEHIASATVRRLRAAGLTRTLDPHSVISIGETMTPHPGLTEVIMWTQYYYEGR